MTFVNVGTLGTVPGKRDLLVQILTHRSAELEAAGCLLYEDVATRRNGADVAGHGSGRLGALVRSPSG